MTPKQLIAEFNSTYEMAARYHRDANAGAIAVKVREIGPQILAALSGLEVARVAMENAREQLWHLAKDKENNPWVKELESALSQLDQEAADK